MRIARFAHQGRVLLGEVLESDEIAVLGTGESVLDVLESRQVIERLSVSDVQLLAPVPRPRKLLAIGLNYLDHITEAGLQRPDSLVVFNKQTSCIVGPGSAVHVPAVSDEVDYEGELGVVIGRRCRNVPADRAHEVVAGYLVVNDVSVRDWQRRSATMTLGKSFDTHGPTGPWLVTADEIADPHNLSIRTWVNDDLLQDGNTKDMVFDIWTQIATLSTAFTLEPGDIIATGTPAGVGFVRTPPRFLRAGDVVTVEIEGVGRLSNPVIAAPPVTF